MRRQPLGFEGLLGPKPMVADHLDAFSDGNSARGLPEGYLPSQPASLESSIEPLEAAGEEKSS